MLSDRSFSPLVHQCLFLTGPTASGKSAASLALAACLGGEILSLDSIAVYRGMDIGTAKPTAEQRDRVPHHLLDLADPSEDFSISRYLQAAHAAVASIRQRGLLPIFVGGTPLYLKALLRGFFVGPPADWEFRQAVQQDVDQHGSQALHKRLAQVDPLSAHRLHPSDVRRMTRALEVALATGRPLSHWQMQYEARANAEQCAVLALRIPRDLLWTRIDQRVSEMFEAGLVAEVEQILANGPTSSNGEIPASQSDSQTAFSRTASQAVGYREVLEMLRGETSLAETIAAVQLHTRQLAKKQGTWLRSLNEVRFIDVPTDSSPTEQIAAAVAEQLKNIR